MSHPVYRILAVDDLLDNLLFLQVLLELEGYLVEVATCGRSALTKLQHAPPDLVLLDFMMPGLGGAEVLAQMRQQPELATIPVLLVSAHCETIAPAVACHAQGWIPKPIDIDMLLETIVTCLQPRLNSASA